jgi:predicted O-methyltransferase YrrM
MSEQPWGITEEQGRSLYQFMLEQKPREILELGAGIGTSACYMAGALAELGGGHILSIDRNPDIVEWVEKSFAKLDPGLRRFHELQITSSSYNDELMYLILDNTRDGHCQPRFDFCFIDGAHLWEVDSCAFFLAEKLLKPGGWMLFDDLSWTISGSPEAQKHGIGSNMTQRLRETEQVMRVYELCVTQHPGFDSFTVTDDWGWARKKPEQEASPSPAITRMYAHQTSMTAQLRRLAKRLVKH